MRWLTSLTTVVLALTSTSCEPNGEVSYQAPFVPFKLAVDTNGKMSLSITGKIVTPLGVFGVTAGLGQSQEAKSGSTILYVYTYVDGALTANVYRINTGQELGFEINGKTQGTVREGRLELRADPGVPTTIEVFDPHSDTRADGSLQPPYTRLPPDWEFALPDPLGQYGWDADLDARNVDHGGRINTSHSDLEWSYGDGLSSWGQLGFGPKNAPAPEECRDLARSNATGKIPAGNVHQGQTFCVETKVGNVAWIRLTRIEYHNSYKDQDRAKLFFTATIWIKTAKDSK